MGITLENLEDYLKKSPVETLREAVDNGQNDIVREILKYDSTLRSDASPNDKLYLVMPIPTLCTAIDKAVKAGNYGMAEDILSASSSKINYEKLERYAMTVISNLKNDPSQGEAARPLLVRLTKYMDNLAGMSVKIRTLTHISRAKNIAAMAADYDTALEWQKNKRDMLAFKKLPWAKTLKKGEANLTNISEAHVKRMARRPGTRPPYRGH